MSGFRWAFEVECDEIRTRKRSPEYRIWIVAGHLFAESDQQPQHLERISFRPGNEAARLAGFDDTAMRSISLTRVATRVIQKAFGLSDTERVQVKVLRGPIPPRWLDACSRRGCHEPVASSVGLCKIHWDLADDRHKWPSDT